ncbi:hypothetical protein ASE48_03925 [Mycobacterium sp. Root265]|uniref:DUF2563 family protein n=1 Tax=Mycobacterium sp. Root265 TaxID=1736504 RepID=UPI00070972DC|nr:DUF2563 family protein [Mycobacterium sp. Root265]KRD14178.1 hypothetical protein ASE48_03925 [Mycobacterium sp. Root265]
MIVDADLLRMGADFSDSAGAIARRGAASLTATQLPANIFGDFDEAATFHRRLSQAQTVYANNMSAYQTTFAQLASKSVAAASMFTDEDSDSATLIDGAAVEASS